MTASQTSVISFSDHLHTQARTATQAPLPKNLQILLQTLATSCKGIAISVRSGALAGILGSAGSANVQGETQQQLDIIANNHLLADLAKSGVVAGMASEELDHCSPVPGQENQPYLVLFDPLDGSSNIDVNVSIGTIFSILPNPLHKNTSTPQAMDDALFLQAGHHQVAAGYVLYGPQTQLVYTTGQGVYAFTLCPNTGNFMLTASQLSIDTHAKEFAINMSNQRHWYTPVQRYIAELLAGSTGPRGKDFNMRWIASMVADVHRVLHRGGVFMYPKDQREPNKPGKLRLMYEANPMALLVEQAGGQAYDGRHRILSKVPTSLHQRCAVVLGAEEEVMKLVGYEEQVE